jgi:hypothetical protein
VFQAHGPSPARCNERNVEGPRFVEDVSSLRPSPPHRNIRVADSDGAAKAFQARTQPPHRTSTKAEPLTRNEVFQACAPARLTTTRGEKILPIFLPISSLRPSPAHRNFQECDVPLAIGEFSSLYPSPAHRSSRSLIPLDLTEGISSLHPSPPHHSSTRTCRYRPQSISSQGNPALARFFGATAR